MNTNETPKLSEPSWRTLLQHRDDPEKNQLGNPACFYLIA